MPMMTIRAVNAEFESCDERDFGSVEDAYQQALAAGVQIATGEILRGKPVCVVELSVDVGERRGVMRGAVSMAAAPLKADAPAND